MLRKIFGCFTRQKPKTEKPADTVDTTLSNTVEKKNPTLKKGQKYWMWPSGCQAKLSKNFSTIEFEYPAKPETSMMISIDLVERLQRVREEYGDHIWITSGYRSHAYQEILKQKGYQVAEKSQHLYGNAADITAHDMKKLLAICEKHFKAIGVGKSFLHVDTRDDKIRRWGYK